MYLRATGRSSPITIVFLSRSDIIVAGSTVAYKAVRLTSLQNRHTGIIRIRVVRISHRPALAGPPIAILYGTGNRHIVAIRIRTYLTGSSYTTCRSLATRFFTPLITYSNAGTVVCRPIAILLVATAAGTQRIGLMCYAIQRTSQAVWVGDARIVAAFRRLRVDITKLRASLSVWVDDARVGIALRSARIRITISRAAIHGRIGFAGLDHLTL